MKTPFFWSLSLISRRFYFRFGLLIPFVGIFCFWFFIPAVSFASAIKNVTSGPAFAVRGDMVTLAVEPSEAQSKVEWWYSGDIVCQGLSCEFDTSDFSAGEYIYNIVVQNSKGLEIAQVSIITAQAPPLYKVKRLNSLPVTPIRKSSFIENGGWLVVPLRGFIANTVKSSLKKNKVLNFAAKPVEGRRYRVSHDGLAIVKRVGSPEEWLLQGDSHFKLDGNIFSLISGEGVWRTLSLGDLNQSPAYVFASKITPKSHQLLVAYSAERQKKPDVDRIIYLERAPLTIECPNGKLLELLPNAQTTTFRSTDCKQEAVETWARVEGILMRSFPWWGADYEKSSIDQWRIETSVFSLFEKGDDSTEQQIKNAAQQGHCAEVFDLASRYTVVSDEIRSLRARCQLERGMFKEALRNLRVLETRRFDPPGVSFMTARAYHLSGDFDAALQWYDTATRRRYEDRLTLAIYAAKAAEAAGQPRNRLAWLDAVALWETDSEKLPLALHNARHWRESRPRGGRLEVGAVMDSQAIPVNSNEVFPMPNNTKASRSVVATGDGAWWVSHPTSLNSSMLARGTHYVRVPTGERQGAFTVSRHNLELGFVIDSPSSKKEALTLPKGWSVTPSLGLGVTLLGPRRVQDLMGWGVEILRNGNINYSLSYNSRKHLDPSANDLDIFDVDLNRIREPGDFSHLDDLLSLELSGIDGEFLWRFILDVGRIDYRLPESNAFDHVLSRVTLSASYPISSGLLFSVAPSYWNRHYHQAKARETVSQVEAFLTWRPVPLWAGKVLLIYEDRKTSNDPTASWRRLVYGFSVLTDL